MNAPSNATVLEENFMLRSIKRNRVDHMERGRTMQKRKTAQELITESFLEISHRKNIDRITVKEIIENCGV